MLKGYVFQKLFLQKAIHETTLKEFELFRVISWIESAIPGIGTGFPELGFYTETR
jgi:hypothetical protein